MTRPNQDRGEPWRRRGRGGSPEPLIMQEEKGGGVKEALRYLGKQGCHVPHQGTNLKEKVSVGHPEGISQVRPGGAAVTKNSKSQRGIIQERCSSPIHKVLCRSTGPPPACGPAVWNT